MEHTVIDLSKPLHWLFVGFAGENGARPLDFDFSSWRERFGPGQLELRLQRPRDSVPYPVTLTVEGTTATWAPSEEDTLAHGEGRAQFVYTVGGFVAKDVRFRVLIDPSLGDGEEAPDGFVHWYKQLQTLAQDAAASAEEAEATAARVDAGLALKVDKTALDDAGIESYTYRTRFNGAFTVTTVESEDYLSPYARTSARGVFEKNKSNRVTVDGVEYVLRTRLWFTGGKVYSYIGNIGLCIGSVAGVPGGTDNVPFVIISDLNDNESIDVLTETAGTYEILVETIIPTQKALPKSLIWDDGYVPIEKANADSGSTFNGVSIGVNELTSKRGTVAIGYGNKISAEFGTAIGYGNEISGSNGSAIGYGNEISGSNGSAIGYGNEISGNLAHAEGYQNTAGGNYSHAEGRGTKAAGLVSHAEGYGNEVGGNYAHAEGVQTAANAQGAHSENQFTLASGNASHAEGHSSRAQAPASHVQGAGTLAGATDVATHVMGVNNAVEAGTGPSVTVQPYNADGTKKGSPWTLQLGKYAEIVGNGASDDERSNARTLDWEGNEALAGDLIAFADGDALPLGQTLREQVARSDGKAPAICVSAGPAAELVLTDAAEDMPLQLVAEIPAAQEGSGEPSEQNPRPFAARTSLTLKRIGAQLLAGDDLAESILEGMPAATINRTAQTVTFNGRTGGTGNKTLAELEPIPGRRCTAILVGSGNLKNIRWQYTDGTTDAAGALPSWGGTYVSAEGKTVLRLIKVNNSSANTVINYAETRILDGLYTTSTVDWTDTAGAIYAGRLSINADGSAQLAVYPYYESYAGETLVGPWVSSMDVYAEGATPTTGAEVIDLGGAATIYSVAAGQIRTLPDETRLSSDAGDVSAVYVAETKTYVDELAADMQELQETTKPVEQLQRVSSLDSTALSRGTVIEALGIPEYVADPAEKAGYSLTEPGWYVFARISAPEGVTVTENTTITGAAGYTAYTGAYSVSVAVRFDVLGSSVPVTINWGSVSETYVFKASDLAVRNLDYRTTFYVYDLAPYVTWSYALTTDAKFVAGKNYYTTDGETYTLAEVTAGETVPANTYYTHSKLHLEGMVRNITYRLDEIVDCPSEIVLPVIEDDAHGCWFEMQLRHSGAYSMTLLPPTGVKVATEHTQVETAGINMIDLHYVDVDGVKLWRFMNTHSTIPA